MTNRLANNTVRSLDRIWDSMKAHDGKAFISEVEFFESFIQPPGGKERLAQFCRMNGVDHAQDRATARICFWRKESKSFKEVREAQRAADEAEDAKYKDTWKEVSKIEKSREYQRRIDNRNPGGVTMGPDDVDSPAPGSGIVGPDGRPI